MQRGLVCVLSLGLVAVMGLLAPTTVPAGPQQQRPEGQIPDRGRQTESSDEIPIFNYDLYFPGTWEFEWRVPESPLGSGGMIEGTEVYSTSEDGRYYTSRIDAQGPDGPFTTEARIVYLADQKVFARYDTDSRGFDIFRTGHVGGDHGGFYTIHYETPPFEANGQQVQLRLTTRVVSVLNYKMEARISIDGGPFTNFGNAWWTKNVSGVPTPQ
jgi:hypothetical protein